MNRRKLLVALGGTATAGAVGYTALTGSGCSGQPHDVGMSDSAFEPQRHTVSVGDTVRWLNTSSRAHSVTAYEGAIPDGADFFASGGFDSTTAAREGWENGKGSIYSCEAFEHTFETPGKYAYFCIPHEKAGMVGSIVVEE